MRRMRHLDASRAGASVVLDARYIAGSDGDLLSSWTDRTGNGYTPTATTTKRPTLKLAQTGGQSVVRFNGTSNVMIAAANLQVDQHTIIVLAKSADKAGSQHFIRKGFATGVTLNWGFRRNGSTALLAFVASSTTNFTVAPAISGSAYAVQTHMFDRVNVSSAVGGASFSNTANTSAVPAHNYTFTVGSGPNHDTSPPTLFSGYLEGDIGQLVILPYAASTFMRKRLEHAAARSFGVACS